MMMLGLEVGLVAVVAHGYWFLFLSSFVSLHVASANVVVASDISCRSNALTVRTYCRYLSPSRQRHIFSTLLDQHRTAAPSPVILGLTRPPRLSQLAVNSLSTCLHLGFPVHPFPVFLLTSF